MADLTEEQLIAFARRAAKRRRDREYYHRHRDAINQRRRERYRETVEKSADVDKEIQRGRRTSNETGE